MVYLEIDGRGRPQEPLFLDGPTVPRSSLGATIYQSSVFGSPILKIELYTAYTYDLGRKTGEFRGAHRIFTRSLRMICSEREKCTFTIIFTVMGGRAGTRHPRTRTSTSLGGVYERKKPEKLGELEGLLTKYADKLEEARAQPAAKPNQSNGDHNVRTDTRQGGRSRT